MNEFFDKANTHSEVSSRGREARGGSDDTRLDKQMV